jgi:predicted DNA-binding transcriptional regulator AlpA
MLVEDEKFCLSDAARYVGVSRRTMYDWRSQDSGPRSFLVGPRKIVYLRSDLDAYLAERMALTGRGGNR